MLIIKNCQIDTSKFQARRRQSEKAESMVFLPEKPIELRVSYRGWIAIQGS